MHPFWRKFKKLQYQPWNNIFVTMWYHNVILVLTICVIASLLMIFPLLQDLIWLAVISHERTELVVPVVQSAAALQVTRSIGSSAAASHRLVCIVMCRHCRGFIQKKLKYTLQDLNQIYQNIYSKTNYDLCSLMFKPRLLILKFVIMHFFTGFTLDTKVWKPATARMI